MSHYHARYRSEEFSPCVTPTWKDANSKHDVVNVANFDAEECVDNSLVGILMVKVCQDFVVKGWSTFWAKSLVKMRNRWSLIEGHLDEVYRVTKMVSSQALSKSGNPDVRNERKGNFEVLFFFHESNFVGQKVNFCLTLFLSMLTFPERYGYIGSFKVFLL